MNPSPRAVSSSPAEPAKTRPRVLIADDCGGTRDVLAQMLGGQYQTVLLNDGSSAWEQLGRDTSIAGLITDIDMPGLDGYELIAKVRGASEAHLRNLPIIVVTGAADQETRRRTFVSGATGLITKPIDRGQLLDLAHAYIHQVAEELLKSAAPTVDDARMELDVPATPAKQSSAQPDHSIEFDAEPASTTEPEPPTAPVASAMNELSVSDLETLIRHDTAASRVTPVIPAELIGIDAALQAIHDGHGEVLTPYLATLEQRLQPFFARYRKHFGHDIHAD